MILTNIFPILVFASVSVFMWAAPGGERMRWIPWAIVCFLLISLRRYAGFGLERIGKIGSRPLSIGPPFLEPIEVRFLHPYPFRPALIGLEDHGEPVRGKRRDRFLPYGGSGPFFPAIPPFLEISG
jgi:hypothetical protein